MGGTLSITRNTRGRLPRLPFACMAAAIVPHMNVSLVFIGTRRSQTLNFSYRQKNKPTNVLSFTLDRQHGEIFITPTIARKQAKKFKRTVTEMVGYLFIHGLLHLKGLEHGSTMDKQEELFSKKFNVWPDTLQQE